MEKLFFDPRAPLEKEVRYNHGDECVKNGEKTPDLRGRFYVKRIQTGWLYKCHNCGYFGYKPRKVITMNSFDDSSNSLLTKFNIHESKNEVKSLPRDMTTDNIAFRGWVKKYGITDSEIDCYGLGYSPRFKRAIIPIWTYGLVVAGFQARFLGQRDKRVPKYLTFKFDKNRILYSYAVGAYNTSDFHEELEKTIVLVEDPLSMIKVARFCDCMALLGSPAKIDLPIIEQITKSNKTKTMIIWLDPDMKEKSLHLVRKMNSLYGGVLQTKLILSDKDPKEYDGDAMKKLLTRGGDS